MSDEPENLLLVYMRRLDAKIDRLTDEVVDLKRRVTAVETQVGQLQANEQSHYAASMSRFDRVDTRLDRIERQIDLVPG